MVSPFDIRPNSQNHLQFSIARVESQSSPYLFARRKSDEKSRLPAQERSQRSARPGLFFNIALVNPFSMTHWTNQFRRE